MTDQVSGFVQDVYLMSDHSSQMNWEGKIQIYGYSLICQDLEVWIPEEMSIW